MACTKANKAFILILLWQGYLHRHLHRSLLFVNYLNDRLLEQSIIKRDAQAKNAFTRRKNPREASPAKGRKIRS
jgi:hypothetical protein